MTKQEHDLMKQMFSRLYAHIGVIEENLKRHGLLADDDPKVARLLSAHQVQSEYQAIANQLGVKTDSTS